MTKKKKIAAYFRRSTNDNKQTHSLERQRKALDNWLKANPDYELLEEFVFEEMGKSADDCVTRPVFNRLLEIVKSESCPFDGIFCSAIDRWCRGNVLKAESVVFPLVENEIELITPEKTFKWDESGSALFYCIYNSFANSDNENRAKKVATGAAKLIENCDLQLHTAYGLKKRDDGQKGLVIDKEKSWVIKRIFQYFLEHNSQNKVTHIMNHDGIKSPRGKSWSIQSIRAVLSNEKYAGFYCYGKKNRGKFYKLNGTGEAPTKRKPKVRGKTIDAPAYKKEYRPDLIEPIIDKETFEKVQLLLAKRYVPYPSAKGEYRYTGILTCSHCGRRMRTRKRPDGIRVWACGSGRQRGCYSNEVKESLIDDATYEMFSKYFLSPNSKELLMQELGIIKELSERTNKELEALRARYREAQKRLTDYSAHLPESFTAHLEALSKEIEAKRSELQYQMNGTDTEEEAEIMLASIGQGITIPDREKILSRGWLEKYVKDITLTFTHTQRGKKIFNTIKEAKYLFLFTNTMNAIGASPITYIFPPQKLRQPNSKKGVEGQKLYLRNKANLVRENKE